MAQVVLAEGVAEDFERILTHLDAYASEAGTARIASIIAALDVLETSPLIGRPTDEGFGELVIGTGVAGCVALYRYLPEEEAVVIVAIRGQREGGPRPAHTPEE
jgi:toxin ParE1/3/4